MLSFRQYNWKNYAEQSLLSLLSPSTDTLTAAWREQNSQRDIQAQQQTNGLCLTLLSLLPLPSTHSKLYSSQAKLGRHQQPVRASPSARRAERSQRTVLARLPEQGALPVHALQPCLAERSCPAKLPPVPGTQGVCLLAEHTSAFSFAGNGTMEEDLKSLAAGAQLHQTSLYASLCCSESMQLKSAVGY